MQPNKLSFLVKALCITTLLPMFTIGISGCSSRVEEVSKSLADIDAQPPIPVPPLPSYVPVQNYNYSAQQMRSPFMPPSLDHDINSMAGRSILPDPSRPRQFLEQFPLEQLLMKGTIKGTSGPVYALVQPPQGDITRVQIGTYMGTNEGHVVSITPNEINLVEIIPNGVDGYVERPRTLLLAGSGR